MYPKQSENKVLKCLKKAFNKVLKKNYQRTSLWKKLQERKWIVCEKWIICKNPRQINESCIKKGEIKWVLYNNYVGIKKIYAWSGKKTNLVKEMMWK